MTLNYAITLAATVTPVASVSAVAKDSSGRWFVKQFVGADWSRRLGRFINKVRRIDRREDRYEESVVDPQNCVEIHHCDEPLSLHRGHGSARTRD